MRRMRTGTQCGQAGPPPEFICKIQRVIQHGIAQAQAQLQAQVEAHKLAQAQTSSASSPESGVVHYGVTCDASGMSPIVGVRYHKIGTDYDLCHAEFLKLSEAEKAAFEKIDASQYRGVACRFMPCPTSDRDEAEAARAAMAAFEAEQQEQDELEREEAEHMREVEAWRQHVAAAEVQSEMEDRARIEAEEAEAWRLYEAEKAEAHAEKAEAHAERQRTEFENAVKCADHTEKVTLLLSMGFSSEEVACALDATKGSLERAADYIFQHRTLRAEEEASLEDETLLDDVIPEEWSETLEDLLEMGFDEVVARGALLNADGDFKQVVKRLVAEERNTPRHLA